MAKSYDFAVFIGRFQPFHQGHLHVIQEGLAQAEKMIVLIGSAWQARSLRNPWTHQEREQMLRACFTVEENARLFCVPLMDVPYNSHIWLRNVQLAVNKVIYAQPSKHSGSRTITLIGQQKYQTGFYLDLFPQWQHITLAENNSLNGTAIRACLLQQTMQQALEYLQTTAQLPRPVSHYLQQFIEQDPCYQHLRQETLFIEKYQQAWQCSPYPPTFVTVDALVLQAGHILLIKRRAYPGKGLWALPGGFVEPLERLQQACLRELKEETRLKVPLSVLAGSIKKQKIYDDPHRSARGRTLTQVFLIELQPEKNLPKIRGGDDAQTAKWLPLAEIDSESLFEDHYFIIQDMLGLSE